ncbi:MAG: alpha/beta hydrolase [Chloroflexi bacterium]|nr:alpha/beta hydrolase [Chloroflexota bacterium]MCI0576250.1 alpha/beta hydrolase [Chloroflexota bacterium]MCI0644554.1 alpha/beta hydrolase [Chloroflexota bacterium]MCI0728757.1 alpha/beta hydrolase [Chloroflexota bacterium]
MNVENYRPIHELVPPTWTEGDILANSIHQHYYRTGGAKPPIVLLHGFMMVGLTWLRVAKALQREYDVIMPDARSHGRSAGPESGFSPQILASDVVALIHTLGLERPILLGHSNGAVTAARLAATEPGLARAAILVDPPLQAPRPPAGEQAGEQGGDFNDWFSGWLAWLQGLKSQTHAERVAAFAASWPHGQPVPPDEPLWPEEDLVPFVEAHALFNLDLFQQGVAYWSLNDYLEIVPQITCPILLITSGIQAGERVEASVQRLVSSWQNGRHVPMPGTGHMVSHGRSHDDFMAVLTNFLATSN